MTDPNPKSRRACPESGASRSRRGGRLPGADAPRGNLNALQHGMRSRQYAHIGALLAQSPKVREALLLLAALHNMQQRNADIIAANLLARLLHRANDPTEGHLLNKGTAAALDPSPKTSSSLDAQSKKPAVPKHAPPGKTAISLPTIKRQTRSAPVNQRSDTDPSLIDRSRPSTPDPRRP